MATHPQPGVTDTVTRFVREELLFRRPEVELDPDTDLVDTGVVDSVGLFRLVAFLEDTYLIAIPPEAIVPENLGSIDAIGRYVGERLERG